MSSEGVISRHTNSLCRRIEETVMEYKEIEIYGYRTLEFYLDGRRAVLICPKVPREDKKWLFKTEYLEAFPGFDIEMLERGYYVAYIKNSTRWCKPEDTDAKARLADFLIKEFGLYEKCLPVGLSCGGMQAVYFAAKYPQYVSVMYIDAPVLNLLSCPCALGMATCNMYEEYFNDTGITISELLNFREHPIDMVDGMIESGIAVALVCGDRDVVVPYEENGKILAEKYRKSGLPFFEVVKEDCNHHPHGLKDNSDLISFVEKHYV